MKKAKTTTVARPAQPAKLAQPVAQRLQHQITVLQHQVASLKHQGTSKHKAHAKHSRHRRWSPDEEVALCSARAVATALELAAGLVLTDEAVLALYWSAATTPDEGQPVSVALRAAQGLFDGGLSLAAGRLNARMCLYDASAQGQCYVLGLDLPGAEPHAVAVGPDGTWWSWGEPFDPAAWPGLAVEEAWAVTL